MDEKLISRVLDGLGRAISIIRPKAYNVIAKRVIFVGLFQMIESQVKIVHALVIALFEQFIGVSEILRTFLNATSAPSLGFILVVMGLLYHLVVTLGKDYIEVKSLALPKLPKLKCSLLNDDKEELSQEFTIRGSRVNLPETKDIPDNKSIDSEASEDAAVSALQLHSLYESRFGKRKNEDLYRERAEVLNKWAGAELIYLKLSNDGETLATGVSIELAIRKQKGLFVTVADPLLHSPDEFIDDSRSLLGIDHLTRTINPKAISIDSDSSHHSISWAVNRIQAQTEECSTDCILLKTDKSVEVECTIFCDEFPKPAKTIFTVKPASKILDVSIKELMSSSSFQSIFDTAIMDGYESRLFESMTDKYEF